MRDESLRGEFKADAELSGEEFEDYLEETSNNAAEKKKFDLVSQVARVMGRVSQYANGKGAKKGINLSLVSGKTDLADSRSTVFFFRTHFGQAGNLLSRILEQRPRQAMPEEV